MFKRDAENTSIAFRPTVQKIATIVRFLQKTEAFGKNWFLSQETEAESFLYPVFDASGELTTAAEAVLEAEFKGETSRFLSAWNGELGDGEGATMALGFSDGDWPARTFRISDHGQGARRLGIDGVKELLSIIAGSLRPVLITVARNDYFEKQVFKDRPGVGWMLYLPRVLTTQQVPEARALVSVMATGEQGKDKQIGTIIVSVTDEPFNDENPEHVKIANAIEIRLVDQDLLPRYVDI
ncbi:MAG: immunity 52 family protein [Janthinobacterium svalbardensis]